MTHEPGTIYSDDEVECFSDNEEEEEEEKEMTGSEEKIVIKSFFKDLHGQDSLEYPLFPIKPEQDVSKKHEKKKKKSGVDAVIEKVREEIDDKELLSVDADDELTEKDDDVKDLGETGIVKAKEKDKAKKERKKVRQTREVEEQLLKDKLKFKFEDAAPPRADVTFLEMNLSRPLLKSIAEAGYDSPTAIQSATIPVALRGRDICACAATGTGKTAAFVLPILQRLIFKPRKDVVTRVLILVPTRELGMQVYTVTNQLAVHCGVTVSLAVGGLKMKTQTEELLTTPDIIIATPGRLIDHIHNTPSFSLREVEVLVLDEADRMLDEFFAEQLGEIVRQCCPTRQTMLFSATMTDKVRDLVVVSLKDPVRVFVNNNTQVAQNLRQEFVRLSVRHGADTKAHRLAVLAFLLLRHFKDDCIVFVPKKTECHRLHVLFGLFGLECGELHGDLKQADRFEALDSFKSGKTNVLFATDVAARGLDIKGVKTVINYTVPTSYEMYIHRVGRTARAGFSGRSVTIARDQGDDYNTLRKIQKNSVTPLYERVVSKKTIEEYRGKVDALTGAVDNVMQLEKEQTTLEVAEKSVEGLKKKISGEGPDKKRNWFQTPNEIKAEKDRLKAIIAGKPVPRRPVPNGNQAKKKEPVQKPKRNKKKRMNEVVTEEDQENDIDSRGKRKSFFDRDLTDTGPRALKKLRKGPSFKEKKDFAERKGKGGGGEQGRGKNQFNSNNNKFKKANKKMSK